MAVPMGRRCSCGDLAAGETVELCLIVDEHREVDGVGEPLLLEAGGERREGGVELREALLGRIAQPRAGHRELGAVALDEEAGLRVEGAHCAESSCTARMRS